MRDRQFLRQNVMFCTVLSHTESGSGGRTHSSVSKSQATDLDFVP